MRLKTSRFFLTLIVLAGLCVNPAFAINFESGFDTGKLHASAISVDCTHWSLNLSCSQQNQQQVDDILDQLVTSAAGVTSIATSNGITGGTITSTGTISGVNAKADASTKGVATFNATNFSDNSSGTINTVQNIATTSSPTFTNLTLSGLSTSSIALTNGSKQLVSLTNPAQCGINHAATGIANNGDAFSCVTIGSVTNVSTTAPITGGPFTTTGTVALNYDNVSLIAPSNQLKVNWTNDPNTGITGVNWNQIGGLQNSVGVGGFNWQSAPQIAQSYNINWIDIERIGSVKNKAINWTDFPATGFMKFNGSSAPTADTNTYLTGNQSITITQTNDITGSAAGTTSISIPNTINWSAVDLIKGVQTGNLNWNDINRLANENTGAINWSSINSISTINNGAINWQSLNLVADINTGAINWASINSIQSINTGGINWPSISTYGVNWVSLVPSGGTSAAWSATPLYRGIVLPCLGGSAVLATGTCNTTVVVPFGGQIIATYLTSIDGTSGSITMNLLRTNAGNCFAGTSMIGSGTKPTLSSATYQKKTTFSDWTSVTVNADDHLCPSVSTVSSIKNANLELVIAQRN